MYYYEDPDQMPEPPRHDLPLGSVTEDIASSLTAESVIDMFNERTEYCDYIETQIPNMMETLLQPDKETLFQLHCATIKFYDSSDECIKYDLDELFELAKTLLYLDPAQR